jgi:hypothetical protein
VLSSALVDFLAVYATFWGYENLKYRKKRSFVYLLCILFCFLFSEAGYVTLFEGHEATILFMLMSPFIIIPYGLVGYFSVSFVSLFESKVLRRVVAAILIAVILSVTMLWPKTVFGPFFWVYEEYRNIITVLVYGVSREAILMGMMAAYPLILLLAIFAATGLCKLLFSVSKAVFLGQVYGASVLSGGTFFLGFLTLIISSTTVTYTLVRALLALMRKH